MIYLYVGLAIAGALGVAAAWFYVVNIGVVQERNRQRIQNDVARHDAAMVGHAVDSLDTDAARNQLQRDWKR